MALFAGRYGRTIWPSRVGTLSRRRRSAPCFWVGDQRPVWSTSWLRNSDRSGMSRSRSGRTTPTTSCCLLSPMSTAGNWNSPIVHWEQTRSLIYPCPPVVRLKIGFLQTHYNLSDREVLAAAQVNVAFRYFLNLALTDTLPHSSLLTVLRARLGASLYQQIFDGVVAQARAAGLVKDRLRLGVTTFFRENPR